MSPLILFFLTAIAIGAIGLALVPGVAGSGRAGKRMKALRQSDGRSVRGRQRGRAEADGQKSRNKRRKSLQEVLDEQNETNKKRKKKTLKKRLIQAGMKGNVAAFYRYSAILGVIVFLFTWLTGVPLHFAVVFGAFGFYALPRWYLANRTKSFRAKFLDEFPNAIEAIVRGVKAGMPVNESMKVVASEAKEPVKTEFIRVVEQQSVGKNMGEAITIMFDRLPIPEVNFFVVVITVQQQSGGNLSEALGNLATVLRNRKKMKAKVKAMSSEAKASAGIIGALPFVVATLVSFVSPSYLLPLFQTQIGNVWLGAAGLLMAMGVFVMYRMVQFEY
ncbi:type II secretion system F family protein [Maritalea mediterranea]|uniref:Type II secretion system F family protein n=1 Tax=Maritalea mediterranea TaxID=2909667 RepID=A0ABS9E3N7_9HYPH|nr:type II secretion system F family protein [Maritalea mediterranea]MCF4097476.1 type II secretion system F family protein [Maritalea mediterranea]